jgi:transposase
MAQKISVLGIDIAKQVFHLVGMDDSGHVVLRKRRLRGALLHCIAMLPPALIGMEACGSAHYWARRFREPGHEVRLMAPQCVKAYVQSPKHDTRDAEAICEAVTRPTMRVVPIQQLEQQDIQALHRVRARLIKARTAFVNEIRGLLSEYGIVLSPSRAKFRTSGVRQIEDEQAKLTPLSTEVFWQRYEELLALEKRAAYSHEKLQALARAHPVCQRVQAIPGVGPLTATAILAAVPDAMHFKNGRQFAAWLGLVPRERATGGKPRLLGISKRGDVYLRTLCVHGARATLRWVARKRAPRGQWVRALMARRGNNRATVALAHKNARIVWALLAHKQEYNPPAAA